MAYVCCLVGVASENVARLTVALESAVADADVTIAFFDVPDIARLNQSAPDLLVLDIDRLKVDALETMRQLRFVLPDRIIVAYAAGISGALARDCHNAGANCMLSKTSSEAQMASGLHHAMRSGCYTDPTFLTNTG